MIIKPALSILVLFTGLALLFSCKKHRLEDEKEILEGTWEWSFSIKRTSMNYSPYLSWTDTIFPSDVSSSYGIFFLKKGKVQLIENGEMKNEYRTVFTKFQSGAYCWIYGGPFEFEIALDNDSDHVMDGCVNSDTLSIRYRHFPIPKPSSGSTSVNYLDFFKKVE